MTGSGARLPASGRGVRVAVPVRCVELGAGVWSATVGVVGCGTGAGAAFRGPTVGMLVGMVVGVPLCCMGPGSGGRGAGAGAPV